jgi:hypothetical protein
MRDEKLNLKKKRNVLLLHLIVLVDTRTHKRARIHSQTHTHTHAQSVGIPWTRDRPVAEISTLEDTVFTRDKHTYLPTGLEPGVSASELRQMHALDREGTGITFSNSSRSGLVGEISCRLL